MIKGKWGSLKNPYNIQILFQYERDRIENQHGNWFNRWVQMLKD